MRTPASSVAEGVRRGAPAGRTVVRVRGLTKRYPERRSWSEILRRPFGGGDVTVLRGVSFDVGAGEFFGLLGPNGAGKTTLFKILATLVSADDGEAEVAGHDVARDGEAVRASLASVVSGERSLYWRLDARENLELFADLHGLAPGERRERVPALLETVGLADAGRKMVGEFSSGMKQRLLLARALLPDPEVLLLDEPTRSLDPLAARDFRSFLQEEIAGRRGCTILLATHDSEEALELCDRVAVLDRGRLLAVGTAEELSARFVEDRYRILARDVEEDQLGWLERRGVVREWEIEGRDPDGWTRLAVALEGGMDEAGQVVTSLVQSGATVARFERMAVPLADLLERIMEGTP